MKKLMLILILTLSLCGCAESAANVSGTETATSATTQTEMPTVTPPLLLSQSLTPSTTEPEAPEVAGCKSEVADGRILYYAEEGNPYGLEAGEVFGEFVPNVNMVTEGENNLEGGWALNAKVVDKLLTEGSAETGEDLINTKIVLPLDISGLDKGNGVDIFCVSLKTGTVLLIEFEGDALTLVNGYDNNYDEHVLAGNIDQKMDWSLVKESGETVAFSGYAYTFDSNYNLYYVSEDFSPNGSGGGYFFGDVVMDVHSPLVVLRDTPSKLDDIFTFQGLPVFLMANASN